MGHGLTESDRMFSVRKPPWHRLGAVLEDYPRSIDEALDKSGLAWSVRTAPVMVERRTAWRDDFGRERPAELERHLRTLGRRRSTVGEYKSYLRVHLVPFFGDLPLERIRRSDVEAFTSEKLSEGMAPKSVRNYLGLLHSLSASGRPADRL